MRREGTTELGTKTELKNMNSFRFLERGIRAEVARQVELLERGEEVVQETLHFDPRSERITSMRSKEEAHDYRYFPEPDLVPVAISDQMLDAARGAMPELPATRAQRLEREFALTRASARQLAFRAELGDFFEAAARGAKDGGEADGVAASEVPGQPLANWVTGELVARLGDEDPARSRVEPVALATLVAMVERKEVNQGGAKQVLDRLVAQGGEPRAIMEAEGLGAIAGDDALSGLVDEALAANASAADKIRGGNMKPMGAIIGHVMRETQGRADGGEVTRLVREKLGV